MGVGSLSFPLGAELARTWRPSAWWLLRGVPWEDPLDMPDFHVCGFGCHGGHARWPSDVVVVGSEPGGETLWGSNEELGLTMKAESVIILCGSAIAARSRCFG